MNISVLKQADAHWQEAYRASLVENGRKWEACASGPLAAVKAVTKVYRRDMRHWKRRHRSVAA